MIHYHGGPMTPELAAIKALRGRHAFVSFSAPQQIATVAGICQSFALDNGAFSLWRAGKPTDWPAFYRWCEEWLSCPNCDWAIIPDVIDGDEKANDDLIAQWPFKFSGVPVWHMHESIDRLVRLCNEWPRVAIGSSGEFHVVGNGKWWGRIVQAMNAVCPRGTPLAKLHGLRMLDPDVFTRLPFSSADSTNVARNIGIDSRWRGVYMPASKETRAVVLAERIEEFGAARHWALEDEQTRLFKPEIGA